MRIPADTAMPRRQPGIQRASISRQVKQQRRGYAQAVLRALARSHRGRPTPQVQRVLRDALSPLGVRLSPEALQELAAAIAAGRPVELTYLPPAANRPGSFLRPGRALGETGVILDQSLARGRGRPAQVGQAMTEECVDAEAQRGALQRLQRPDVERDRMHGELSRKLARSCAVAPVVPL